MLFWKVGWSVPLIFVSQNGMITYILYTVVISLMLLWLYRVTKETAICVHAAVVCSMLMLYMLGLVVGVIGTMPNL